MGRRTARLHMSIQVLVCICILWRMYAYGYTHVIQWRLGGVSLTASRLLGYHTMRCAWWSYTHNYAYIYTRYIPTYRIVYTWQTQSYQAFTPHIHQYAHTQAYALSYAFTWISHNTWHTLTRLLLTTIPTQCQHVILCIRLCTHTHARSHHVPRLGSRQAEGLWL